MPAFVHTKKDEVKWKRAKQIVSDQKGKAESSFEDRDWGLVNHIYHAMEKSQKAGLSIKEMRQMDDLVEKKIREILSKE